MKNLSTHWQYPTIGLLTALFLASTAWAVSQSLQSGMAHSDTARNGISTEAELDQRGITPLTTQEASNSTQTASDLAFIVEEEKLAHDVYQTLYDKWNARVFGNIQASETAHQNLVIAVMQSRSLTDPRLQSLGSFADPELQTLYDQLIAQGTQSVTEAYKVGVAIEEKDIADIKDMLTRIDAKDTDVKEVLESLLQGSENHLRAFNRQVNR